MSVGGSGLGCGGGIWGRGCRRWFCCRCQSCALNHARSVRFLPETTSNTANTHPCLPAAARCPQWRLLSWAWLVCLAFVPEIAAKAWARSQRFDAWRGTAGEEAGQGRAMLAELCPWPACTNVPLPGHPPPPCPPLPAAFRHACAAAAALNIAGLMAANLAGFVLGLDGLAGA